MLIGQQRRAIDAVAGAARYDIGGSLMLFGHPWPEWARSRRLPGEQRKRARGGY
jgi:hypothetical protein